MVPFLKWVGGKRQLLSEIRKFVPNHFDRYVEPFLGGGAVFFDLNPHKAWINDVNPELINCYEVVRDDVAALVEHLQRHKYEKSYFLAQRSLDREEGGLERLGKIARASRFIYLNKTAFNGMYRVNSKGFFNVPFGRYKDPKIVNAPTLEAASVALKNVKITNLHFSDILKQCVPGDFVYLDPPYIPLSATSSFTQYSQGAFDMAEQKRLASDLRALDGQGIKFLASNAHADEIFDLYAGFGIMPVQAKRAINAKADGRKAIQEVLITNM